MLHTYSLRQDALAAQNGLWHEGLRPISVSDKGQQREGGPLQAEASISHCIIALLRGRACNCSTNVADWVGARTRFVRVHVCRSATSWGVLRKIPPLRRCGRLDARRLGNSATENLKPSETSGKKGGRFPNTALLCACQGGLFLGPFSGTPFFRGRSEGHRKRGLRPSRFHGQALAGFEEAAARIPAPRPPSNPVIPASQCSLVCGWRRGVSLGRVRRCDVLSRDCRVGGRQAFLDILLASPSKQGPFPAKGGPSSRLANRGWTQDGVINLHGHQRVQTTQAPCHKGD